MYKGSLPDGREVAVKQLRVGSGQGEREFKAEVDIISRVHHRHLVSLVGYCISDNERMLVYHFVPNDTLYYHLHGKKFFLPFLVSLDFMMCFQLHFGVSIELSPILNLLPLSNQQNACINVCTDQLWCK